MKAIFTTTALALAALAVALPTNLGNNARQFQIEPPSTSFPDPVGEPPVTLPPDTPVILPPITGPIQIGKRDAAAKATRGGGDEWIIFPPVTGPLIPDKPIPGSPIKPDPTVPGKPLTPGN